MKPPPPPRRDPSDAGGRTTLVGGLPWADPPGPDVVPGMPAVTTTARVAEMRRNATPGPRPRQRRPRVVEWLEDIVRRSQPATVSLSLHVIVLLALALCVTRQEARRRLVLDLSFTADAPQEPTAAEVAIAAPPAVEPEPEVEPVKVVAPEPAVPDPKTSPPPTVPPPDPVPGPPVAEVIAPSVAALLDGRSEGRREALLQAAGGTGATELAVGRALEWLKKCQNKKDGLWSLQSGFSDPATQENRLAATAMALLAFQGAGHTTAEEGPYKVTMQKAWKALAARQGDDGVFDVPPEIPHLHRMYSHAQVTIAACELAGMTGDAAHLAMARRAVDFAVKAQGPDGGWRYGPGEPGDMSVTGWYVMALKSAEMAGIAVPAETFRGIEGFLETVSFAGGSRYGYMRYVKEKPPLDDSSAVSAEGLLARQFLGWRRDDPRITEGVQRLLDVNLPMLRAWGADDRDYDEKDVYAWYYLTQVVHHRGGDAWRQWNQVMREVLPRTQVQKGRDAGSWDPSLDHWGSAGGRHFETCFCTWMLEVYYRHLPLYGDEAVAGATGR